MGNGIVEFTGGEPLLQMEDVINTIKAVCDLDITRQYHFLIETNGSVPLKEFKKRMKDYNVYIIMDIKLPSSGRFDQKDLLNLNYLTETDEVKFVCQDRNDYEKAKKIIKDYELGNALISTVFGKIELKEIAGWILEDKLPCRFQIQLHKIIFNPLARGV
jgi:7-carboxy-7-deazaguanine synthase